MYVTDPIADTARYAMRTYSKMSGCADEQHKASYSANIRKRVTSKF